MQARELALFHDFLLLQLAFLYVFVLWSDAIVEVVEQDHMHRLIQLELEHVENVKKCLKQKWTSCSGSKGRNPEQDQARMGIKQEESIGGQMVKKIDKSYTKEQIHFKRYFLLLFGVDC